MHSYEQMFFVKDDYYSWALFNVEVRVGVMCFNANMHYESIDTWILHLHKHLIDNIELTTCAKVPLKVRWYRRKKKNIKSYKRIRNDIEGQVSTVMYNE
jgi:hypothetical protein